MYVERRETHIYFYIHIQAQTGGSVRQCCRRGHRGGARPHTGLAPWRVLPRTRRRRHSRQCRAHTHTHTHIQQLVEAPVVNVCCFVTVWTEQDDWDELLQPQKECTGRIYFSSRRKTCEQINHLLHVYFHSLKIYKLRCY